MLWRREKNAVNPQSIGTKAAARYRLQIGAGQTVSVRLRLTPNPGPDAFGNTFDELFLKRGGEADEFYEAIAPAALSSDERLIQRQAFATLLWNKQFYNYNVRRWLRGDPAGPEPPRERLRGRNHGWAHL